MPTASQAKAKVQAAAEKGGTIQAGTPFTPTKQLARSPPPPARTPSPPPSTSAPGGRMAVDTPIQAHGDRGTPHEEPVDKANIDPSPSATFNKLMNETIEHLKKLHTQAEKNQSKS